MAFKLFPLVLVRIGGLAYNQLEDLTWLNKENLQRHFQAIEDHKDKRDQILQDLENLIRSIDDYPAKFYLKILKRAIFNRRKIKIKSFDYTGSAKVSFYKVLEQVKKYKLDVEAFEKANLTFKDNYVLEENRTRTILQNTNFSDDFAKGLQLTSHSFLKRFEYYQEEKKSTVNKKLLQTEHTLLQFLSRTSAKTSPFSSLTKLGLFDLNGKLESYDQRKVRLNNTMFQIFRDVLIHHPPFFKKLTIRLNASLTATADEWVLLLNTRNIESIQKLDRNPLIDFIVDQLKDAKSAFTFESFLQMILEHVDADLNEIQNHLLQLIDYGLIEWDWPFSGLDPEWLIKLQALLDAEKDPLQQKLKETILQINKAMRQFELGDIMERGQVLETTFSFLKKTTNELLEATQLKDLEQDARSDQMKKIFRTKFNLIPEQIFYEDVSQPVSTKFSKSDFEAIAMELEQLTQLMQPFYYNSKKSKVVHFFKNNYPSRKVDLLTFYHDYFKETSVESSEQKARIKSRQESFYKSLLEKGSWESPNHFHLGLAEFEIKENTSSNTYQSKGTLAHIYKASSQTKAYMDSVFMGHGKMFGRFLHLFPKEAEQAIKMNNTRMSTSKLWAELVDASVYNPNIHPSLIAYEIQMPGSQNNLPLAQQISISNLEIRMDDENETPYLFDNQKEKRIMVFDFGFEAIQNRSPLYQLLACFAPPLSGPDLLNALLENGIAKKEDDGIVYRPKVTVGKHLTIRRPSWEIHKMQLPLKEKSESQATYFSRVNEWRMSLHIPQKVFIKIAKENMSAETKSSSDAYKPQYIDFYSPLFVRLLAKQIRKVSSILTIEAMLPLPDLKDDTEHYIQECLIEWQRS